MSMPPEPPERLAEILLEILALSKPTRTSQSKSDGGGDPVESRDARCVKKRSPRREEEEDNNRQRP
jgi:hypothetical protein